MAASVVGVSTGQRAVRTALNDEQRALVERHLCVAERGARHFAHRSRGQLAFDECLSAAYLGLVEAARRFKAGRATFASFAFGRVQFHLMDLRRQRAYQLGFVRTPRSTNGGLAMRRHHRHVQWPLDDYGQPKDLDIQSDHGADVERRQLITKVVQAQTDPRDRKVLRLMLAGKTLKETGQIVGVNESRTCQLMQRIVETARAVLN